MTNIAALADTYAQVKMEIEKLEEQLKAVKKDIVATGRDVIEGERFTVKVALQERKTISAKEAEQLLDAYTYAKLLHVSEFEVLRYKAHA